MHTITTRTLVASCTLLTLAACGGRNAGDSAAAGADSLGAAASGAAATMTDSLGMRSDSMGGRNSGDNVSLADANTTAQLDSVATAARGGLTSLAPSVAIPLIRSLEEKLDNSEDRALDEISDDLEELREELENPSINTKDVANTLARLGPRVTAVAARGGAAQSTLQTIGSEITKAATQLGGRR